MSHKKQKQWPIDEAQALYRAGGPQSLEFTRLVASYLSGGYVYSGPDAFILARPVEDAWFVRLAVGRGALGRFLQMMPYRLPYVQWERKLGTSARRWSLETFERKVNHS